MMKKIVTVLSLLLLLLPSYRVKAEHYPEIETDFTVTFNGTALTGNYDEASINKALQGMEPGDTADLEFTIKNTHKEAISYWMSNDILKSFEDGSKASGGAYSYELRYKDSEGKEKTIYSSKAVGGEGNQLVGLHEATDALDSLFLLEELPSGKEGVLTIHIELDGETQTNIYQDTLARLRVNFAVELPDEKIIRVKVPKTSGSRLAEAIPVEVHFLLGGISFLLTVFLGSLLLKDRKEKA
ncbi:MAG: hypothetical protein IIZ33_05620 [Erysipelotrichaceae bacterium]|nr:hypothetical protein [Erysipelotrichaceae bacterium]